MGSKTGEILIYRGRYRPEKAPITPGFRWKKQHSSSFPLEIGVSRPPETPETSLDYGIEEIKGGSSIGTKKKDLDISWQVSARKGSNYSRPVLEKNYTLPAFREMGVSRYHLGTPGTPREHHGTIVSRRLGGKKAPKKGRPEKAPITPGLHWNSYTDQRNLFEILLIQTKIRLYFPIDLEQQMDCVRL